MTATSRAIGMAEQAIINKPVKEAAAAVAVAYDLVAKAADRRIRSPAVGARLIDAALAVTRMDAVRMATYGLPEIEGRAAFLMDRCAREALAATAALDRATRRAA